jgi:CDGSH-type Zn-finger protein
MNKHSSNGEVRAAARTPPDTVTIRCRENGPLVIEMPQEAAEESLKLQVTDHLGVAFTPPGGKRAIALCRCSHSHIRPFCDGSHRAHGFLARERADSPPPT